MEHEDNNTQFGNNYLRGNLDEFSLQHNQQNLVENLQNASGFGAGGIVGVVEDIVGGGVSIGGKFDKEEHDEEEWKYVQEVQQSEKQQHQQQKMLKVGEGVGDGVGGLVVDYDEDEGGDDQVLLPTAEYEYEEESAIIKNDGDFSTTSNTTSTTVGEEENSAAVEEEEELKAMHVDDDVVASLWSQVEKVEKEVAIELLGKENNLPETAGEKSSLATGENCENLQQQQQYLDEQHETQAEKIHDNMFSSSSPPLFAAASNISAEEEEEEQKHEADKENADPAVAATAAVMDPLEDIDYAAVSHTEPQSLRPSELDLEMHSNLNPDAKEFVPVCSNPTSPISPEKTNDFLNFVGVTEERPIQTNASPVLDFGVGDKNETDNDFGNSDKENENDVDDNLLGDVGEPALSSSSVSPHPNAVPRHMIGTTAVADDVVAQSPRKGRGLDMDEISLPAVNDFELEANERPHEIEQEDVVVVGVGDGRNEADNKDAVFKQMENGESMHRGAGDADVDFEGAEHHMEISSSKDYTDFKHPLDHGPETSVDLDMDSHDVMKQSFYIENSAVNTMDTQEEEEERVEEDENEDAKNQPIEELLNTVQPIPTDSESINNSFDDLLDIPSKEMLNVEEKEVISQSPSTEEIQMQFQNELNASSKDVSAIPIDMDSIGHMQDSFYMENTHNQNAMEMETETEIVTETSHETHVAHADELVSLPTLQEAVAPSPVPADELVSLPTLQEPYHTDIITPHKTDESIKENYELLTETAQPETAVTPISAELQFTDFPEEKEAKELVTPSSPYSTEEKHLMEDTKEHINLDNGLNELEQKMEDLLSEHDSSLQKVDDVAQIATPIDEKEIASFVQESEITQPQRHEQLLFEEEQLQATSSSPLLEQEHHHRHHHVEEEISASLIETPRELNVSQMQAVEDFLSSPLQEVVPSIENISEIALEPSVKENKAPEIMDIDDETPAIVHVEASAFVKDEANAIVDNATSATLLDEAPVIVDHAIPKIAHDDVGPSVPVIETLISAAEAPFLQTEATVSMPEYEVAVVTNEIAAAAIAATAAVAATAATVAAVAAVTSEKKSTEPIKKPTSTGKGSTTTTTAKSKLSTSGDAKKSMETKKPTTVANKTSTLSATARPRTAPATSATKTTTAGSAEKKTTTTTTTTARPATHTTTARKPLTNNVTATKSAAKTSTARPTTLGTSSSSSKTAAHGTTAARNGVAAKTPAPRPATATLASRKPMTTTTSASSTQPAAAKPRPSTGGAATKPNTLNIAGKPKVALSPRATLTSQLRKTAGPTGATAATAKSPTKTAASSTTNGSVKPPAVASSSTANRTKTTTTTTTTTTKTFTARPAPKITSTLTATSTLNTTARRATTGSATKTSSSNPIQRKSSPSKPTSTGLGGKMSPTKTNAIFKNKTKEFSTPKTAGKTTGGTTEVQAVLKVKQLVAAVVDLEEQPKINGASCIAAGEPLIHTENGGENGGTHGVHYTHEENGSIEQGEMALMDGTAA